MMGIGSIFGAGKYQKHLNLQKKSINKDQLNSNNYNQK